MFLLTWSAQSGKWPGKCSPENVAPASVSITSHLAAASVKRRSFSDCFALFLLLSGARGTPASLLLYLHSKLPIHYVRHRLPSAEYHTDYHNFSFEGAIPCRVHSPAVYVPPGFRVHFAKPVCLHPALRVTAHCKFHSPAVCLPPPFRILSAADYLPPGVAYRYFGTFCRCLSLLRRWHCGWQGLIYLSVTVVRRCTILHQ